MHKDEQGIVSVDQDKCIGCRSCEYACPYRAPHFNAATGKMNKCDFCRDLLAGGKAPICVDACVTRSISYGILEELQKEYGFVNSIEPLPAAKLTHPSLVITPHRRTALSENAIGKVLNLSEEL
jgi:anaerobic dimethyl sulfoxide reductase subunit B (iron-sulfur subunit)